MEFPNLGQIKSATMLPSTIAQASTAEHQQAEYSVNSSTNSNTTNNNNYANKLKSNDDKNLFSLSEINSLINEVITNLSSCSNRIEQFHVITQLAIKYLYGK